MITAETLSCVSSSEPPNYVQLIPNWVTSLDCDLTSSEFAWDTLWQAVAAIATLVAVFIAIAQTQSANKATRIAEKERKEAQYLLYQQKKDDQYRNVSRFAAWVEVSERDNATIQVHNGSDDVLYEVIVRHHGISPLGFTRYPIVPPGFTSSFEVSRFYLTGPNEGKRVTAGLVHVEMMDSLGNRYQRAVDNKGILTELGPCS